MYLDQSLPPCENGCGNQAIRFTKKGKAVCSYRPAGCPAVLKRMQGTCVERYGFPNASSCDHVKDIRKEKAIEKYGVDNVSKAPCVKKTLSEKRSDYWNKIYENKDFTIDGMDRATYGRRCHQYAETQYSRHIDAIDPNRKRSKDWHVDHIFSVTDGFLNDVPINIISDISNLRLITDRENYKKNKKSEKTLAQLYEDFSFENTMTYCDPYNMPKYQRAE
jgi:hypothetical protein